MKHVTPPIAVDLLDQAIQRVRNDLELAATLPARTRIFWAGVAASRRLGAVDVVTEEFWKLAFSHLWKRHAPTKQGALPYDYSAYETTWHLIRWGLLARDPFGEGLA